MKVPNISGGDTRMGSMPDVRIGNMATAEQFGAGNSRQMQQLGNALQHAGHSVLDEAQRRQRKEDDAFVTSAVNKLHMSYADESKKLFDQYKGDKAVEAPAAVDKMLQTMRGDLEKTLRNRNQKEAFAQAWDSFAKNSAIGAMRYRDDQIEQFRNTELNAQNELVTRQALEVAAQPGGMGMVLGNANIGSAYLSVIEGNTDKLTEGMPAEARQLARESAVQNFHTKILGALSVDDPAKALEYLSMERVKNALPAADVKKLRTAYEKQREKLEENDMTQHAVTMAIELYESGGDKAALYKRLARTYGKDAAKSALATWNDLAALEPEKEGDKITADEERAAVLKGMDGPQEGESDEAYRRRLYTEARDIKLAELAVKAYEGHEKRDQDRQKLERTASKQQIWQQFSESGYDASAIPPEIRNEDAAFFKELVDYADWYNKPGREKIDPDFHWIYQMEQKSPEELREWLNAPAQDGRESNFDTMLRKTAGNTTYINKLFKQSLESGTGGGKGDGTFKGAAKFDPAGFFENAYGDVFQKGIIWTAPENYYDADTNTAKSRRNGFLLRFNNALAEKEAEIGRAATSLEQRDIAFEILKEARTSPDILDSSFYTEKSPVEQSPELSVAVDALPPAERQWNQGEDVVVKAPVPGVEEAPFGSISPTNTRMLGPDIIDYKPTEVLRAYRPGRLGNIQYVPGDVLAYGRFNEIVVFDQSGVAKGNPIVTGLPGERAFAEQAPNREAENALRQELNRLQNQKRTAEQGYAGTYGKRIQMARERGEPTRPYDNIRWKHEQKLKEFDQQINDVQNKLNALQGAGANVLTQ